MRVTRNTIQMWMAGSGRPANNHKFADIYFAAIHAGMNGDQAMALTCQAYDAAKGYDWHLPSGPLQMATRRKQAELHPNGQWATLQAKHGAACLYWPEGDARIRDWTTEGAQS